MKYFSSVGIAKLYHNYLTDKKHRTTIKSARAGFSMFRSRLRDEFYFGLFCLVFVFNTHLNGKIFAFKNDKILAWTLFFFLIIDQKDRINRFAGGTFCHNLLGRKIFTEKKCWSK